MSRRLSRDELQALGDRLSPRERNLIETVASLKLVSHAQAAVLLDLGEGASAARIVRRRLQRLTDLRLLARLERRIGGVRAGSAGYVYYLGPAGQRLIAYWQGRGLTRGRFRSEPGSRYVRHRLAVSELYVQLAQAASHGRLELLHFEAEPDCWRAYTDGFGGRTLLKPDAYLRLGLGAYEDSFFVEVDLGSESTTVIARKLRAYLAYFQTGVEQTERGVFPRVLLLTNSRQRAAGLVDVCARLPAESWQLFTVARLERAVEVISGQVAEDQHNIEGAVDEWA
jgi:Replication-relaxation